MNPYLQPKLSTTDNNWSSEHSYLTLIENQLKCEICKEMFTAPMSLTCGHTFCSFCIRNAFSSMGIKKRCPLCTQDADEMELRKNVQLENIAVVMKKNRNKLMQLVVKEDKVKMDSNKKDIKDKEELKSNKQDNKPDKSTNLTQEYNSLTIKNNENKENKEKCPVCYIVDYKESHLKLHLVNCLNEEEEEDFMKTIQYQPPLITKPKYLAKLPYDAISDKQLKKCMKEHNLSTTGDRITLQKRHMHYTLLYNSNLDSIQPKSTKTLLVELEKWENIQKLKATVNLKDQVQCDKHLSKYKRHFEILIAEARKKRVEKNRG